MGLALRTNGNCGKLWLLALRNLTGFDLDLLFKMRRNEVIELAQQNPELLWRLALHVHVDVYDTIVVSYVNAMHV